jgi:hypothetical protein
MTTQPEALRLADALEVDKWHISGVTAQSAADELRRLHALNQELLAALRKSVETTYSDTLFAEWNALIAKAEGQA